MRSAHYLTARQAADALGVTRATLYAYASRGQIRSEAVPGQPRERRYHRDDIERLQQRKAARRDPSRAAAQALNWGGPVLESGITLIHDGSFYYRGHDATTLASSSTVEDSAALLWGAEVAEREALFGQPMALTAGQLGMVERAAADALTRVQIALPIAGSGDPAAYDLRPSAVRFTGARIVRLFARIVAGRDASLPLHRFLQSSWAPRKAEVAEVIRTTLVLCADHELNVSAFTARCAASAGATPYDVVSAALATLKGYRHGGAATRVLEIVRRASTPKEARAVLVDRLRHGERVPGFGHPLYPGGDPRAALLLRLAAAGRHESAWTPFRNLIRAGSDVLDEEPNLDLALAAVTRAYRLPGDAPLLLFALGRTIGWVAHAIEEYASGQMIRPRARYTGPAPLP